MTTATTPKANESGPSVPDWVNSYPASKVDEDTTISQAEIGSKKRRMKRGTAVVLAAILGGGVGYAANDTLKFIDTMTQKTVNSVTETMPSGGDYISLAKQAVIDLGLNPENYSATDIGQGVTGDSMPQPGQPVRFDEVQHWYGVSVDGSTVDTDK